MENVPWENFTENVTVDQCTDFFTEAFTSAAHLCMPSKIITVKSNDAAWINDDIRLLINQRRELYKKAKKSNSEADWTHFRRFRNQVVMKIRKRKYDYLADLDRKASDPHLFGKKDWWKIVKTYMKKKIHF